MMCQYVCNSAWSDSDSGESKIQPQATHIFYSFKMFWYAVLYMYNSFFASLSL